MAFLMLLHEKMRLQRRQNKLTLKQLRMGNKIDRIKRNIEKKQKYYQKLEQNLEKQAKMFQDNANMFISNKFGIGCQTGFDPTSLFSTGISGMTGAAWQFIQGWNGKNPYNGNDITFSQGAMSACNNKPQDLLQAWITGGFTPNSDGKTYTYNGQTITEADIQQLNTVKQYSSYVSQQNQMYAQNMKTEYQQGVSIWLEAQKEQLNYEQDMVLDALQDEENDYEMEKTSIETELEYIKERKQAIESALAEGVKDSAPKFGLG